MVTEHLFASAVQHAKACSGRDELVLKSKQVDVLKALKDCFVWFPNGYGKSLCYRSCLTINVVGLVLLKLS